jgi:hypothetical protein
MAHVSGPVSTLPGCTRAAPADAQCDAHPTIKAAYRVQGETDSFGAEYADMCDQCYAQYKQELAQQGGGFYTGTCGSCSKSNQSLFAWRDPDEGMAGPVYYACRSCKDRINERQRADAEEYLRDCDSRW